MTQEKLTRYLEMTETLADEANKLLARYFELKQEITGNKPSCVGHLHFLDIDIDEIRYEGEDSWSYGGHEEYSWELPTSYLTDPDWESKARVIFEAWVEKNKKSQKASDDYKRKEEIRALKALQEKYPDVK